MHQKIGNPTKEGFCLLFPFQVGFCCVYLGRSFVTALFDCGSECLVISYIWHCTLFVTICLPQVLSSMSRDSKTSLSCEYNRVVSVEAPWLSLLSSSAPEALWRSFALAVASFAFDPETSRWDVWQFLQWQANAQSLLHLRHFQCSVRQPVLRRQSEVSDACTSSTALKRSLLD